MRTTQRFTKEHHEAIHQKMAVIEQFCEGGGNGLDPERVIATLERIIAAATVAPPPITLAEMIERGCCSSNAEDLTDEHFPVDPDLFTAKDVEVLKLPMVGKSGTRMRDDGTYSPTSFLALTTDEAIAAIKKMGYRPGGIEHLLAYNGENQLVSRKYSIVALGSRSLRTRSCRGTTGPCVPVLGEFPEDMRRRRQIGLEPEDGGGWTWPERFRFLAVRR